VCSDVYALPKHAGLRGERFDVGYTSRGVLCWLPVLGRWASVVAHFLRPGGVFYILETHPFRRLLNPRRTDSAGTPIREGYFAKSSPTVAREHGSYANPAAEVWNTAYYFSHTLGDVVTALCAAGLRIEFLHEFPASAVPTTLAPPALPKAPEEAEEAPGWFSIRAVKEERR
jgi:SAM-dependent methyltransferase